MSKRRPSGIDPKRVEDIETRLRNEGVMTSVEIPVRPGQLEEAYFKPKSFEDIHREDSARQRMLDRRRPLYPAVKVAGLSSVLFLVTISFISNIPSLWYVGQAGIFFSFLFAIVLIFVLYGTYQYIVGVVYSYGKSLKALAGLYIGAFGALSAVGAVMLKDGTWSLSSYIVGASVVLFLVLWSSLTRFLRIYHQL